MKLQSNKGQREETRWRPLVWSVCSVHLNNHKIVIIEQCGWFLPRWCPAIDTLLVQGFTHFRLMNADVSQFQSDNQGLCIYLVDQALLHSWGHFDWALTSLQSSQSHKVSSFVDCLPHRKLISL